MGKWSTPTDALENTDSLIVERSVPKSYSLPTSVHKQLADEARRRSMSEGRRVSATQVLLEILREHGL